MDTQPKMPQEPPTPKIKIYFLPNLLTAGNLFCGFLALTKIVNVDKTDLEIGQFEQIISALKLILLACIFDLFDGRVARMGGRESPFGREFDSLADLISFGVAPAFLVYRVVLRDVFYPHEEIGWFIASIYLVCGAFRLARFNCLAAISSGGGGKEFLGFPIPSAAGLVASLTLFMIWIYEKDFSTQKWKYILPVLLLFLSWMMVSEVKYPTFKQLDWKATRTFYTMLAIVLLIGSAVIFREKIIYFMLPLFFTSYLVYGFIRPYIPHKMREEIEEEDPDEDDDGDGQK
jgi:CDP-diacylglycerol--serine O-phosphatidyltransferase